MKSDILDSLLSFEKVPDVDARPGLYAWYLKIKLGKRNIESPQDFSKALKKFTEKLCYPVLDMQLEGHFNMILKGDLRHIWYGHDGNPFSDNFEEMLNHREEREVLNNILELAVPLLTGPLYIGVSKNLRQRLQEHTRLIRRSSKENQDSSSGLLVDSPESLENDKIFAERITERNIDPNHLFVGVAYVDDPYLSIERIKKIVQNTETLLNRLFYPILGRK